MSGNKCRCSEILTTALALWCKHYEDCPKCSCEGPFFCPECDEELNEVCISFGNTRVCDHEFECSNCICEPRWGDETLNSVKRVSSEWVSEIGYVAAALYNSEINAKDVAKNLEIPTYVAVDVLIYFAFIARGIPLSEQPLRREQEEVTKHEMGNLERKLKEGASIAEISKEIERSEAQVANLAITEGVLGKIPAIKVPTSGNQEVRRGWTPSEVQEVERLLLGQESIANISATTQRPTSELINLIVMHELAPPQVWFDEFKKNYSPFDPHPNRTAPIGENGQTFLDSS